MTFVPKEQELAIEISKQEIKENLFPEKGLSSIRDKRLLRKTELAVFSEIEENISNEDVLKSFRSQKVKTLRFFNGKKIADKGVTLYGVLLLLIGLISFVPNIGNITLSIIPPLVTITFGLILLLIFRNQKIRETQTRNIGILLILFVALDIIILGYNSDFIFNSDNITSMTRRSTLIILLNKAMPFALIIAKIAIGYMLIKFFKDYKNFKTSKEKFKEQLSTFQ